MREQKYQAWIPPLIEDGEEVYCGFMVNVDCIDFNKQYIEAWIAPSSISDCILGLIGCRERNRFWYKDNGHPSWSRPYILREYTSKKDKNNKEIYEGDILSNGTGRIGKVIWFEPQACFDVKPLTAQGTSQAFSPNNWIYCEVIGNIYENPELVKSN